MISADGTVCVAYVAGLRAFGMKSAHAGLELYSPDGRREVIHGRSDGQSAKTSVGEFELSFDVPGGPFVLTYRVLHGAWTPAGDPPCDGLRWCVKVARAEAVGRWMNDPERPELRGVGYLEPRHIVRLASGFLLGGAVYGCLGFVIGAVSVHEIEGIFAIVLLTNIDVGWLQNPIYYATSERRALIESLPGHYPTQLAITGAFTDDLPRGVILRSLVYAVATLLAALLAFGLRIRPARCP